MSNIVLKIDSTEFIYHNYEFYNFTKDLDLIKLIKDYKKYTEEYNIKLCDIDRKMLILTQNHSNSDIIFIINCYDLPLWLLDYYKTKLYYEIKFNIYKLYKLIEININCSDTTLKIFKSDNSIKIFINDIKTILKLYYIFNSNEVPRNLKQNLLQNLILNINPNLLTENLNLNSELKFLYLGYELTRNKIKKIELHINKYYTDRHFIKQWSCVDTTIKNILIEKDL